MPGRCAIFLRSLAAFALLPPAAVAGIARGAELLAVDGVDVTLTSIAVQRVPVQAVRAVDTPTGRVGYLHFTDPIATAERQLADALAQLRGEGISDLVLASSGTCSASESVINALRGIDVEVSLVGGATCGKPYGFLPQDNCGTTYFAIQFEGVNAKGFGDYADGFAPTCAVADDFTRPLGDPAEARFAAALAYLSSGTCPAAIDKTEARDPELARSPARENRILRQ